MPEIVPVQVLGGKLDEYLFITQWDTERLYLYDPTEGDLGGGLELNIRALVKPVGVKPGDSSVIIRHKLLLAYECAMHILEEMKVHWVRYPELLLGGEVIRNTDGSTRLVSEARVELVIGVTNE
jgi:hypothetical protein